MRQARARDQVANTAHLTAWIRALGRQAAQVPANGDFLAERFLLPHQRWLSRLPNLTRQLLERSLPGAFGYFNARTCYFDDVLLQEADAGLDQLVLLGAGFDSRPIRFAEQLAGTRVFEVDMPQVLRTRAERLAGVAAHPASVAVPIDFENDDLGAALSAKGYRPSARTLFLWEGVTYYLPPSAVEGVLASVASQTQGGSSIVFDYVTQAFFEGDHSSYGAKSLADGWRRRGNLHLSGVQDVAALVNPHGFKLRSEVAAEELAERYLRALAESSGREVRAWGCFRIGHAERT
jgi:methyltransferase (TIGR00027 family)